MPSVELGKACKSQRRRSNITPILEKIIDEPDRLVDSKLTLPSPAIYRLRGIFFPTVTLGTLSPTNEDVRPAKAANHLTAQVLLL